MAGLSRFAQRRAAWTEHGVGWLFIALLAMWATGCVLFAMPRESLAELPAWQATARHACVVVHGIGAWAFCLLAGRWVWPHLPSVWQRLRYRRQWWLGVLSMTWLAALGASGLMLLYGGENLQATVSWLHWWVGASWPLPLAAHLWR